MVLVFPKGFSFFSGFRFILNWYFPPVIPTTNPFIFQFIYFWDRKLRCQDLQLERFATGLQLNWSQIATGLQIPTHYFWAGSDTLPSDFNILFVLILGDSRLFPFFIIHRVYQKALESVKKKESVFLFFFFLTSLYFLWYNDPKDFFQKLYLGRLRPPALEVFGMTFL